jgi:hypothetical protein
VDGPQGGGLLDPEQVPRHGVDRGPSQPHHRQQQPVPLAQLERAAAADRTTPVRPAQAPLLGRREARHELGVQRVEPRLVEARHRPKYCRVSLQAAIAQHHALSLRHVAAIAQHV